MNLTPGRRTASSSLLAVVAPLLILLAGCSNLAEVREYAHQARQLTEYKALTEHWAATASRERHYLFDADLALSQAEDAPRQEVLPDLLAIHHTVARYFAVLGRLAGDRSVLLDDTGTGRTIRAAPGVGVDARHVDAHARVAAILSDQFGAPARQRALTRYLEDGNAPIQTLQGGMRRIVRVYTGTLRNEKGRADFLLLAPRESARDRLVAALASLEHTRLQAGIDATEQRLHTLDQAINQIAAGHQRLYEGRHVLSTGEMIAFAKALNADLRSLRHAIGDAKEKYDEARN